MGVEGRQIFTDLEEGCFRKEKSQRKAPRGVESSLAFDKQKEGQKDEGEHTRFL